VPSPEPVLVDVPELLEVPGFVVVEVAEFVDVEEVPDTVENVRSHFGLVKPGSQLHMQTSATLMAVPWLLQLEYRVHAHHAVEDSDPEVVVDPDVEVESDPAEVASGIAQSCGLSTSCML